MCLLGFEIGGHREVSNCKKRALYRASYQQRISTDWETQEISHTFLLNPPRSFDWVKIIINSVFVNDVMPEQFNHKDFVMGPSHHDE